jgi:BirA family biotin operon repressor/biotin-[acetyl-CoA-carboxylase] ligase
MKSAARIWRLQVHEVLPSTSDLCRSLAAEGEPDGLAVLARRQSQARGSRGRGWETPTGNLALSVLVRPALVPREAAQMSLLAGVAVAETVTSFLHAPSALALKWPNDVLLDGAKLAGILTESHGTGAVLDWVVLGMGVNLAHAPDLPDRRTAKLPVAPDAEAFAGALLERLGHWLDVLQADGFAPIRAAWRTHAQPIGSAMTLKLGGTEYAGGFAGLAHDGGLQLAIDGTIKNFTAGEVLLPNGG